MSATFEQFLKVLETKLVEYPVSRDFFLQWESFRETSKWLGCPTPDSDQGLVMDLMRSMAGYFYILHGIAAKQRPDQYAIESLSQRTTNERKGFFHAALRAAHDLGIELDPEEVKIILSQFESHPESPWESIVSGFERLRFSPRNN